MEKQLRYKYVQSACEYCTVQAITTFVIHSYFQPFAAQILILSPNLSLFKDYYDTLPLLLCQVPMLQSSIFRKLLRYCKCILSCKVTFF